MTNYCYLYLTCQKGQQWQIAQALLDQKLIACAKFFETNSMYQWKGKIEKDNEILIMFETRQDLYDLIAAEIAKIHTYDTYVLQMVPVLKVNSQADKWYKECLMGADE